MSIEVGFENIKLCVELVLIVIISGFLLMKVFLCLDYNSNVVEGVEKLDIEIVVILVYNFF